MAHKILTGDALTHLKTLRDQTIHTCVTSPPYFGLRDYGSQNQIGLESSPAEYVEKLVEVFREVRRALRDDGTLWLNLGDSYARAPAKGGSGPNGKNEDRWGYGSAQSRIKDKNSKQASNSHADLDGLPRNAKMGSSDGAVGRGDRPGSRTAGLDAKQLLGIPWRVAFALQQDGWYLRQDIIWHKPNPMPESVRDRCTKAHEYIFLLSKSPTYYFDSEAMQESATGWKGSKFTDARDAITKPDLGRGPRKETETRNRRSVWTVPTKPFREAHFATFPPDLIRPCILAGSPPGGVVLDPFSGAATTGVVAIEHGRHFVGFELNPEYVVMAEKRLRGTIPLPLRSPLSIHPPEAGKQELPQ